MLRQAIAEFPSEIILQKLLASALHKKGFEEYAGRFKQHETAKKCFYEERDGKYTNRYWEEAITLYEKLLESDNSCITSLIIIYSFMGEYEMAEKAAGKQHMLTNCRELMFAHIRNPQKEERFRGAAILALLHELRNVVEDATARNEELKNSKDGLGILQAVANMYEVLMPEGDYGIFNSDMCMLMLSCATVCTKVNDYELAFHYLDKAFSNYQKYDTTIPKGPLFKNVDETDLMHLPIIRLDPDFFRLVISELPEDMQEKIKSDSKYAIL